MITSYLWVNQGKFPMRTVKRFILFWMFCFSSHYCFAQNFIDVSTSKGITESFGSSYNAGGVSFVDFNQDGYMDLTFGTDQGKEVVFYQSNSGSDFTSVNIGIADVSHQTQVLWVDIDNDDDLDFYIAAYNAPNKIYINDGNLNFTDISATSGIPQINDDTFGTVFGDIDQDGDLDMFVSNFFYHTSQLYANNGNNTFTNITATSGLSDTVSLNFCAAFFDYDSDGDLDLYNINDRQHANELFLNNGNQTFTDISSASCADIVVDAMSACVADFNNDERLDMYVSGNHRPTTAISNFIIGNVLLKNEYPNKFQELTSTSGTNYHAWCWGGSWADYDNDGWQDIYVSNGGDLTSYKNVLYFNNGDETFTSQGANQMVGDSDISYSCSTADFNNDGKMDIIVGNTGGVNCKLWQNNILNTNNFLKIELEGTVSNSKGIGSWIKLYAGSDTYTRFTHCGIGFLAQESNTNHFGISAHTVIDSVVVIWPSGIIDKVINPPTDSIINIEEGTNQFTVVPTLTPPPPISTITNSNHSVSRNWMELLLESIRRDYARPTIHARNLYHSSVAMFDAWAAFQNVSIPFMLGNTQDGYNIPFTGITIPANVQAAQEEAISHAMYNLLKHRFQNSPGGGSMLIEYQLYMNLLGYNILNTSIDYSNGDPARLGNYIAHHLIQFGLQDGSNEQNDYSNLYYQTVNDSLVMDFPGNPNISNMDRWQPLTLDVFIDQSGNQIPGNTPDFLSPEWGNVSPFALQEIERKIFSRNGNDYQVYCDPGPPPLHANADPQYAWGFALVSAWSSHLDSNDNTLWDISPASIGNVGNFPTNLNDYPNFYNLQNGGDNSAGHSINPATQAPYAPQFVKRADYARVLAEFWADGPDSETPPGHWFTLLNYVSDHPSFQKQYQGAGTVMNDLEWDIKAYFSLGGPMHDAAISAWGIKGWYDYIRPVSAIRAMADLGQRSDPSLPNYHSGGLPLIPNYIELITATDPLAGTSNQHVNKIKLYSWKGPDFISNPSTDEAGVDWILAEEWWPYQRPSFVTPPFAGYVSGHSTYSRAAAEILTNLTGDAFFPGGMGEFSADQDNFLVFENGPSQDLTLQWATYRDASDQCSLSRIWGGIHPPADDIPGRIIGEKIGIQGFNLARHYILGTICENIISENNNPIPYSLYKANEIHSAGTVISPNVSFEATQFIELNPGFEAVQGAIFNAEIKGCN